MGPMMRAMLLALLFALAPTLASGAAWNIDGDASEITFKVGYLQGASLNVAFRRYGATIDFDPARPEATRAQITLWSDSIDTRLPPVDALVKSPGYLNAEDFPTIVFDLNGMRVTSKSTAVLSGKITLLGVTRPITLDATLTKLDPDAADPADRVAAFEITGQIDRRDFGSTAGAPEIETVLPIHILLEMHPAP
jgi:polyisoprenoid-binding protein YceI